MKRYKSIYKHWIAIKFEEELRFSDFQKHAGISSFTDVFRKDRQHIKGPGNKSAKLVKMIVNKNKDYIKFLWLSEPTYSFDTQVTKPKSMKPVKDNLYTEIVLLQDIFKLLKTKPNFKSYQDISLQDIKEAIKSCNVKVTCDCMSQWWQGFSYYLTQLNASVYDCDIAPKRWNKPHNSGDGLVCKHLDLIIGQSMAFWIPIMAGMIKKYLNTNK
jgi:hypothetical protein